MLDDGAALPRADIRLLHVRRSDVCDLRAGRLATFPHLLHRHDRHELRDYRWGEGRPGARYEGDDCPHRRALLFRLRRDSPVRPREPVGRLRLLRRDRRTGKRHGQQRHRLHDEPVVSRQGGVFLGRLDDGLFLRHARFGDCLRAARARLRPGARLLLHRSCDLPRPRRAGRHLAPSTRRYRRLDGAGALGRRAGRSG